MFFYTFLVLLENRQQLLWISKEHLNGFYFVKLVGFLSDNVAKQELF